MQNAHPEAHLESPRPVGIGLPGRLVVALTVSGAMILGGFLVAIMTLTGRLSGGGLLLSSTGLFLIGALVAMFHALALGYLGREPGASGRWAALAEARSILYAIPALAAAWPFTNWIAMTVVSRHSGKIDLLILSIVSSLVGLAVVATAVRLGWTAMRNAYARWPERRAGTAMVVVTFLALLVLFLGNRPEIWGTRLVLTPVGAVVAAAVAALWIVGPMVTLSLRVFDRLSNLDLGLGSRRRLATNLAIGVGAGIVMALVVLPFHRAPVGVPTVALENSAVGALAVALSRAFVDEVLLRLGFASIVVWLMVRYRVGRRSTSIVLGIAAAAILQVLLYLPGVVSFGFASNATALAYLGVAALLPAAVFGTLFFKRGFSTALLADSSALVVLALLAS